MAIGQEALQTEGPASRRGCIRLLAWSVLLLAILVAILWSWDRFRTTDHLRQTLAELDNSDPGWRMEDIEAARATVPEDENSARIVVLATRFLPKDWPSSDFPAERLQRLLPSEKLNEEDFAILNAELASAKPALESSRALMDMPRGRHHLQHARNPIQTLLTDQATSRRIVNLLLYEAMRQNQEGKSKEALGSCRAALNAARSLGDEPIAISQLIRNACVLSVCYALERTLAQGEPPTEDMAELQKVLENEDAVPSLLMAMRGERAFTHKLFEAVETGDAAVDEIAQSKSNWVERSAISLWRMDTRKDHALALSLMAQRIREVQLPMHEQAEAEKAFEQEIRALPQNAFITRTVMPAFSKLGEAFRRKHAYLRCTIAALAAERYRREKKTWPQSLAQLVPHYLAVVPLDPFDGAPLRYRRNAEGCILYSVGSDTVDNGGNLDREHPIKPGVDLGIRLWDVPKRRQPPQPKQQFIPKPE